MAGTDIVTRLKQSYSSGANNIYALSPTRRIMLWGIRLGIVGGSYWIVRDVIWESFSFLNSFIIAALIAAIAVTTECLITAKLTSRSLEETVVKRLLVFDWILTDQDALVHQRKNNTPDSSELVDEDSAPEHVTADHVEILDPDQYWEANE